MLKRGEKIHVIHRQLFDGDAKRHFVGEVEQFADGVVRACGHVYSYDPSSGFVRRPEERTRLISICDHNIINILPSHVHLESIRYEAERGFIMITDDSGWEMEISYE